MMLSSLLRASSCRALAGACSGAAALAGTRVSVLGRRHYLAPSLLAGLDAYGEQFGHVRVPTGFVVPDADGWPEEARGLALGLQVSGLRTQKKRGTLSQDDVAQLEALRFVWDVPEWRWQCVLQSLLVWLLGLLWLQWVELLWLELWSAGGSHSRTFGVTTPSTKYSHSVRRSTDRPDKNAHVSGRNGLLGARRSGLLC